MSSWKSIIAGRENDVYFLLKELVENREIAKAIGDFKGLSGPKKEGEDEEDERSLEERLKDFSKDRAEQRTKFEQQLQSLERGIKNNQPDLQDIVNEIFFSDMIVGTPTSETKEINYLIEPKTIETQTINTSGVSFQENKFKKRIKETLKDLYRSSDERKDEEFSITDKQFDLFAEENFENIKHHISRGLAISLGLRASRKDLELSEKEAEKEVESRKKYLEKTKTEKKEKSAKLEKQIKALEKLAKERGKLKADKITSVVPIINATYENEVDNEKIADILDLPKKPIFDSAEEANDFIVSFNKVQRKRNQLQARLKKIKDKKMSKGKYEEKDEFAQRKRKRDRSISGMEKAITRLNKTLKEEGVKVTQIKQFRDLLSMNLDSKIKSLKGKLDGLSQEVELAERRVELAVLRAASVIDEDDPLYNKKRQEMFKNLERLGKDIKVDLSKKGIEDRIKQENLKAFNSDKKKALETFDKTTKVIEERIKASFKQKEKDKLITEGKEERPQAKESVVFSEIFSEIEGKTALKTIKELLNEEGFKQYLSILDKKIVIEPKIEEELGENFKGRSKLVTPKIGDFKRMTRKEKNDFVLDNMPKFQGYYTRLMGALNDLQAKTPTEDKKITKIKKLMESMQGRFKRLSRTERKERAKKSPIRYGADRSDDKRTMKEKLAEEEKQIYQYFFENAKGIKNEKQLLTSEVNRPTITFWKDLSSNMDAFAKATSNYQNKDDFVKAIQSFIGKNNLHVIDILNLMGTKRNNKIRSDILTSIQSNKLYQDLTRAKKEAPTRYKKETLEQKIARQKREGVPESKIKPKDPFKERRKALAEKRKEKESMLKSVPSESEVLQRAAKEKYPDKDIKDLTTDQIRELIAGLSEIDKKKYFGRRRKGDSEEGRYSPVDFRTEEQSKESKEKRMLDWGKLKLEDAVKLAKKIRGAEDSDDFDTSKKTLHTLFTKEKSKEDKNRFFAFVDVNRKAEVVVRGFSYKKGDKGYNEIEKAADSILKNLEKEVTYEGQEMTILEVINRISRGTFKYKAGRVDSDTKDDVREQFGKLVEEAIKNVKVKKSEQFRIPKFFKSRMKEDTKVFRNDLMNIFSGSKVKTDVSGVGSLSKFFEKEVVKVSKGVYEINTKIILSVDERIKEIGDIYEQMNATDKIERKEKDIDSLVEEKELELLIYGDKQKRIERLVRALNRLREELTVGKDTKIRLLGEAAEKINEKIDSMVELEEGSPKYEATKFVVNFMQDSADRIQEEIKEIQSKEGEEQKLLDKIEKVRKEQEEELALFRRMVEAKREGRLKQGKGRITIKPKEEKE